MQAFPDQIHIFYFQEENCCRKDGRTKILVKRRHWNRWILMDTAKIRTLKLFSNSSKNGGHLYVKLLYEVFVLSPMDRKDYMVSE